MSGLLRLARALFALALLPPFAATFTSGCAVDEGAREAQSITPLEVTVTAPIPTYRDGALEISIGEGRDVTLDVKPATHLELIELQAQDPYELLGRRGHGPFVFRIDASVLGPTGRRQICAIASDAAGTFGDACFWAVP